MLPISQICENRSVCLPQNEEMDRLGLKTLLTLWKKAFFSKINLIIVTVIVTFFPPQLGNLLGREIKRKQIQ